MLPLTVAVPPRCRELHGRILRPVILHEENFDLHSEILPPPQSPEPRWRSRRCQDGAKYNVVPLETAHAAAPVTGIAGGRGRIRSNDA